MMLFKHEKLKNAASLTGRRITSFNRVSMSSFWGLVMAIILVSCVGPKKISLTFKSRFAGIGLNDDGTYRYRVNRTGHYWVASGSWEKISNRSIVLTTDNPGLKLKVDGGIEGDNPDKSGQLGFVTEIDDDCLKMSGVVIELNIRHLRGTFSKRMPTGGVLKIDDSHMHYPIHVFVVAYQAPELHFAGTHKLFSNDVVIDEQDKRKTLKLNVSFECDIYGDRESPFRYIRHTEDTLIYKNGMLQYKNRSPGWGW